MNTGPKTNIFLAVCGVVAAGLGVVGGVLPIVEKPAAASAARVESVQAPADIRVCTDPEKEVVAAALRNYGRAAVEGRPARGRSELCGRVLD
jgi:hypothetical protein